MGEDGGELDEIEARIGKVERRPDGADFPSRDIAEVLAVPGDERRVDVDADQATRRIVAVPADQQPPRAAADIEHVAHPRISYGAPRSMGMRKSKRQLAARGMRSPASSAQGRSLGAWKTPTPSR